MKNNKSQDWIYSNKFNRDSILIESPTISKNSRQDLLFYEFLLMVGMLLFE